MASIQIPETVAEAIKNKRCVAFVGAGASQGSGVPGWRQLLQEIIKQALKDKIVKTDEGKELRAALKDPNKFLDVAQHLNDRYGTSQFRTELSKFFENSKLKPSSLHKAIMDVGFRFVVTTNYDKLLEDAFAKKNGRTPRLFRHNDVDDFADALWEDRFFILKAHGDVATRNTMVLTQRDYRELIFTSPGYRHLLASIFTNYLVLFIGASLTDPEINLMLSGLHSAFHGSGKNHFALIEESSIQDFLVERWRKDYNVNVIQYKASKDTHPEVLNFVKRLSKLS